MARELRNIWELLTFMINAYAAWGLIWTTQIFSYYLAFHLTLVTPGKQGQTKTPTSHHDTSSHM